LHVLELRKLVAMNLVHVVVVKSLKNAVEIKAFMIDMIL